MRNLNLSSSEVEPNNPVEASVEVSNVSGSSGKYTVDLVIGEVVENSRTVTLSPGETTTVSFSIQKKRKKIYSIKVEDLTENFKVVAPTEFEVNADEVKDNALKSMENVNTVKAEMERTFGIVMGGNLNETTTRMLVAIDRENQRMVVKTIISGSNEKRKYNRYLVENTIYLNMGSIFSENTTAPFENFPEWVKFEAKSWKVRSWFAVQKELLERGGVKRLKNEKVDGKNCRVLKIESTKKYQDYMEDIIGQGSIFSDMGLPTSNPPAGENALEAVENMSMKGWYSRESGFPLKIQLQIQINMNDLAREETPSLGRMRIEMIMKFHSFNEPLSIELPEVAENAVPLTALENNSMIERG